MSKRVRYSKKVQAACVAAVKKGDDIKDVMRAHEIKTDQTILNWVERDRHQNEVRNLREDVTRLTNENNELKNELAGERAKATAFEQIVTSGLSRGPAIREVG